MQRWCSVLAIILALGGVASATTYIVSPDGSGDFPTIRAAIEAVSNGDTILLADGTFTGPDNCDIDFLGKAVTLRSSSSDPHTCIIDCFDGYGESHRGFLFINGEGVTSRLEGITIKRADVHEIGDGGGIYCVSSSPVIRDCRIISCWAMNGGGMYCHTSSPTIENCTFAENDAELDGSGIYCFECSRNPVTISGCTFAENCVYSPGGGWGTIVSLQNSDIELNNTIIAFNSGAAAVCCNSGGNAWLTCCDLYGNTGGDWVGFIAGQYGVDGNLSEDPLFCGDQNPIEPYALSPLSPCAPEYNPECGLIGAWPVDCGPPVIELSTGHLFQDGFGQHRPHHLVPWDRGNANIALDLSGGEEDVNSWLGDSAQVSGPNVICEENRWLVNLCIKLVRKGPYQDRIPGYTEWKSRLPCDPETDFVCVLMDSLEILVGGSWQGRASQFVTYFHENESGFDQAAGDLSEVNEILPDDLFVPGTQIEYYYASYWYNAGAQPETFFILGPFTFEILPGMQSCPGARYDVVWPSVLYIDASNRGTEDYITGMFERLGIPYDKYDYLDSSSSWSAPLARSFGGSGFNPGGYGNNGCTLEQLLGYRLLLVTTGALPVGTMSPKDFDMIEEWMASTECGLADIRRGVILNGDRIAEILDPPSPFAGNNSGGREHGNPQFMHTVLGANYRANLPDVVPTPSYCIFLEDDEDPPPGVVPPFRPGGSPDVVPEFRPDEPGIGLYGGEEGGPVYNEFCVLGIPPEAQDAVGNLSYVCDDIQCDSTHINFAQVVRSNIEPGVANWRSVIDGFSLHRLSERFCGEPTGCSCDSICLARGIDLLMAPELEWIMGGAPDTSLTVWNYPCNPDPQQIDEDYEWDRIATVNRLYPHRPNPSGGSIRLRFSLAQVDHARLNVYDATGRLVWCLVDEVREPGEYTVEWNGRASGRRVLSNGVYWVRLETGDGYRSSKRLLIIR